jgi:hypothetical protein
MRAVKVIGFTMAVDQTLKRMYDLIVLPAVLVGVRQVEEHVTMLSAMPPERGSRTRRTELRDVCYSCLQSKCVA